MDSRIPFVKQVAKTIIENHAKYEESFIFGISGKWGEGKTRFLGDLNKELQQEDGSFEIFDINPWKFSTDKISFLRNFLKIFSKKIVTWTEDDLKSLDFDTSKTDILWGRFIWLILSLFIIGGIYVYLGGTTPQFIAKLNSFISQWKLLITILLAPFLLAIIGEIVVVQKSDRAVSTLDKFDDLLNTLLKRLSDENKKIIVFVDDLDRVTPETARDVLDNLRTFFDKKEITFVVTGDHSVLERYLGKDLLPDGQTTEQLEEGRRFMKKIFNVYWRLPLPIEKELDTFLSEQFKVQEATLNSIFPKEEDRKIFKNYLRKYFEKNFRQIIRFLDTTIFTFQIIQQKSSDKNSDEGHYFKEVFDNPLLEVRILMIQELCAPLFEWILNEYQVLGDLEYAVEKKETAKINQILDQYQKFLSPTQQNFIKKFIYEEPRFYKQSSLTVSDIQPFLFLAADASFGDQRGPSGADFISILASGDPAQVKNSLLSTGDTKAGEAVNAFITQLPNLQEPNKTNQLKTILIALSNLPAEYSVHKVFGKELAAIDLNFLNSVTPQQRMEVFNPFWCWLDIVKDSIVQEPYKTKFPFNGVADLDSANFDSVGIFTSSILSQWLVKYYPSNKTDAINRMSDMFPKLDTPEVCKQMGALEEGLVNDLISDSDTGLREKRFELIKKYTLNGKKIMRENVFEAASALNGNVVPWVLSKSGDVWERSEIESAILEKLDKFQDFNELSGTMRFIVNNKIGSPEMIWPKIIPKQTEFLISNMPQIINDESYRIIAPPPEHAGQIMEALIEKIKGLGENEQIQWLDYIKKPKWLWTKLDKKPSLRKFSAISKSTNEQFKQALTDVTASWSSK